MPTYLYETVPAPGVAARRFEVRQGMDEPPLATDPETGESVRRVISGGLGVLLKGEHSVPESTGGCGPESCRCGKYS